MAAGARSPVRTALSLFKMGAPKAGFMDVFEIATGQWTKDTSATHHIYNLTGPKQWVQLGDS